MSDSTFLAQRSMKVIQHAHIVTKKRRKKEIIIM